MISIHYPDQGSDTFVLLDDGLQSLESARSRLYEGFIKSYHCSEVNDLSELQLMLEADKQAGLKCVLLASYEFGRNLHFSSIDAFQHADIFGLKMLVFKQCQHLHSTQVNKWLNSKITDACAGIANIRANLNEETYHEVIAKIQRAICAGETYQINYTYQLIFEVFGSPIALYQALKLQQVVHYGALIALPDGQWILSFSPELFFEKKGQRILAKPMKGTMPKSDDPKLNQQAAEFLQKDSKNRAENVMIVDLLRNDLSRIAKAHSVQVSSLFAIESYQTVWQMVSEIEATVFEKTAWIEILKALFPCGSITGAPKYYSMQLIDALEKAPRGLYTGVIGWLDTTEQNEESLCLSVAIRTLILSPKHQPGMYQGYFGVGGGIVLDSTASSEWQETKVKSQFLMQADPKFVLFETMYVDRQNGIAYLANHLQRLQKTCAVFSFPFDLSSIEQALQDRLVQLMQSADNRWRLKLSLNKQGQISIETALLKPLPDVSKNLLLASDYGYSLKELPWLLRLYKTSYRAIYDQAWRHAEALGAFDMLFVNEQGELTEGGRSNLFIKQAGKWWTPPLSSGLLSGIMRAQLLNDPIYQAKERVLNLEDIYHAEKIMMCNALRGCIDVRLKR